MRILPVLLALAVPAAALAERADRFERTVIRYDGDMRHDTVKGVSRFSDNVVLTRGSLWIASDNLLVTEAPDGYRTYTVTAPKGGVAKFRQKLDGGDDKWINGEGKAIVFREKEDDLTIDEQAVVKVSQHGNVTEEASSTRIIYDARSGQFFANSGGKVRSMLTLSAQPDPLNK